MPSPTSRAWAPLPPIKFLYANRASHASPPSGPSSSSASAPSNSTSYHPYDLVIVERKHINPLEYFTISTHGIVHITSPTSTPYHPSPSSPTSPSPSPLPLETESTSLSDWVHQSSTFTLLRSIRFFQHFLISKLFRLWKANVRFRVFCHQRRALAGSLFLARPSFCTALMDVQEVMAEMRGVALCSVRVGTVYSSDTFGKEQGEVRTAGVKRVEGWVERVEDILESVCKGVKDRARLYDHRIANEELSNSRFAQHLLGEGGGAGGGEGGGGVGGKVKSMVAAKEEKRVRLKQLRHANREADMLGEFIRLVDYIEVETLVGKCIDNTAEFLSLLLSTAKPLFTTSVSFSSSSPNPPSPSSSPSASPSTPPPPPSLLFTPTSQDISSLLNSLSDLTITSIDSLSRVIAHPKFQPLLRGGAAGGGGTGAGGSAGEGGLRVAKVVHADRGYEVMMGEMERRIAQGFVGVNDSVRFLEKHRVVWEYGENVRVKQQAGLPLSDDDISPPATASAGGGGGVGGSQAGRGGGGVTPISSLTHTLTGLTKWSTSLQHIRDLYSSGLVQADCRSLKLTLLPITEAAIQRKRRRMVELFVEGVESVMSSYATFHAALRDEPLILSQYIDYVRAVQGVKEAERTLRASLVRELDALHSLMLTHDVYNAHWVATSDQVKFDEMRDTVAAFSATHLREAETKLEGKWEEMKGKVMGEIKKFEAAIEQLTRAIDDQPLYTDYAHWGGAGAGSAGVKEVMAALDSDGKRIKELQKRTEEMQRQQVVLEETSHHFKGLGMLVERFGKKRAFFAAVEGYKEREKKFLLGEVERVDWAGFGGEVKVMEGALQAYVGVVLVGGGGKVGGGREGEMVKTFRADLAFYSGGFLGVVRDLQRVYQRVGVEGYKATFAGFGHLKRMKDLRKIDWTQHRQLIQQTLEDRHIL